MKSKLARLSRLKQYLLPVGSIALAASINKGTAVATDTVGLGAIATSLYDNWIATSALLLVFLFIIGRMIWKHWIAGGGITSEVISLIIVAVIGLYGLTIASGVLTAMPPAF